MSQKSLKEILEERKRLKAEGQAADKREQRAKASVASNDVRVDRLFAADQLREYQKISVLRALSNFRAGRCTLDASDMGLGKTRMAGAFIGTVGPERLNRILWLTSKSLVKTTRKELAKLGLTVVPVDHKNFEFVSEAFDETHKNKQVIFIANYEILGNMSKKTRDEAVVAKYLGPKMRGWDALFMDECTKVKGGANVGEPALIWKLLREMVQTHQPQMYRYFLSGTPVENHPREVWAYLHLFDATRFPKLSLFEKTFCDFDNEGNMKLSNERLFELLRSFIIRNTYTTAGIELPPVTEIQIDCELEKGSDTYVVMQRLKKEFSMWLDKQEGDSLDVTMLLEQLLRQRQLLATGKDFNFTKMRYSEEGEPLGREQGHIPLDGPFPKLDILEEKVFDLINAGEQVVIFCCFNDPLIEMKRRFDMFCRVEIIAGGPYSKNTPEHVEDFQQGKIQILLINKMSGAHGLNLQKCDQWPGGASHMFHIDRWWNPAREAQAIARLVRMNTNAPVFNHYLHVAGEVDDVMLELNKQKQAYADAVDSGLIVTKDWIKSKLGIK